MLSSPSQGPNYIRETHNGGSILHVILSWALFPAASNDLRVLCLPRDVRYGIDILSWESNLYTLHDSSRYHTITCVAKLVSVCNLLSSRTFILQQTRHFICLLIYIHLAFNRSGPYCGNRAQLASFTVLLDDHLRVFLN